MLNIQQASCYVYETARYGCVGLAGAEQSDSLRRFLGVSAPDRPFPRKNEGASEMAWQIVRFIVRHPLAVMGITKYTHKGPLDFDAV